MANQETLRRRMGKLGALAAASTLLVGTGAILGSEIKNTNAFTWDPVSTPTPRPSEAPGNLNPEVAPMVQPASQIEGRWVMTDPDAQELRVDLPEGFTPDSRLVIATNINKGDVDLNNLDKYQDWEEILNTGRPVGDRLSGYNYDYNDWCPTSEFLCNMQLDMYAWRVLQGENVSVPGIGTLEGGEGRSVVLLVLNSTPDVVAFDNDEAGQVLVKRGFTATGREFDANPYSDKFPEMEENLLGHWLFRQANGTPEKSYVGITDNPDNANSTLFAVVVRNQWGFEADGQTPRYQFQLLDADIVNFE